MQSGDVNQIIEILTNIKEVPGIKALSARVMHDIPRRYVMTSMNKARITAARSCYQIGSKTNPQELF